MYVLFVGTDGTGKSTLLRALSHSINSRVATIYLGLGDGGWCLDSARKLYSVSNQRVLNFFFWYFLFPIEIILRRHRSRARSSRITLIDRFPGNPFLKGGFVRWLYRRLLPKPDLVVLLYGDPQILALRKPGETTQERTTKDIRKWESVVKCIDGHTVLKLDTTELDLNECTARVLAAIGNGPAC